MSKMANQPHAILSQKQNTHTQNTKTTSLSDQFTQYWPVTMVVALWEVGYLADIYWASAVRQALFRHRNISNTQFGSYH